MASRSSEIGRISSSANFRAATCQERCSLFRAKSMAASSLEIVCPGHFAGHRRRAAGGAPIAGQDLWRSATWRHCCDPVDPLRIVSDRRTMSFWFCVRCVCRSIGCAAFVFRSPDHRCASDQCLFRLTLSTNNNAFSDDTRIDSDQCTVGGSPIARLAARWPPTPGSPRPAEPAVRYAIVALIERQPRLRCPAAENESASPSVNKSEKLAPGPVFSSLNKYFDHTGRN